MGLSPSRGPPSFCWLSWEMEARNKLGVQAHERQNTNEYFFACSQHLKSFCIGGIWFQLCDLFERSYAAAGGFSLQWRSILFAEGSLEWGNMSGVVAWLSQPSFGYMPCTSMCGVHEALIWPCDRNFSCVPGPPWLCRRVNEGPWL